MNRARKILYCIEAGGSGCGSVATGILNKAREVSAEDLGSVPQRGVGRAP
jgi:hypothetical protein